ncbi:MAG TPA: NB-ARC domain-containing protein, partial [Pyrinomonadaceae bacterium]
QSHTAIVRGWPGVGKTTLVSVLSRDPDVGKTYVDGVLWTSLDQKPALMSILAGWGRALGRDDLLRVATPEEAVQQLGAILQHKRMLLIVDDVWDAAHGALFQHARSSSCGLLITTRLPEVADALAQTEQAIYNLPVLTEEDALKLMRILAPAVVEQHPNECRELVKDLEYLPLALHVAARLLRAEARLGLGVSDLLRDIREGAAVIEAKAPADRVERGTLPTVAALLQKSTDVLDEHTRNCFAYLGAFAPKPATFDLEAMKAVWQVDDPKPAMRALVEHGLLEPVGSGRFQMHALLVKHARSLLEE